MRYSDDWIPRARESEMRSYHREIEAAMKTGEPKSSSFSVSGLWYLIGDISCLS